ADYNFWDPEIAYNYELGMKSELLDGRLRLNGAVFYQEYEDYQITQSVVGLGTVLITNAAEVESKGLEVDFLYLATDNLAIDGSLAYIRTKYGDYQNAPCFLARPECVPNGDQYVVDLTGKLLDNAPEWTFNLGAEYRAELASSSGLEWFARLDAAYRDDTLLDQFLVPESKQDSYVLVNARVGLESIGKGWKVTFWGNNITDEKYAIAGEWQSTNTGLILTQGLTRTYGMTLDWQF
ncbi:MAG: TonB-dependent receptor, partial [Bacteroidales bacterium]|nr:TonB-dependent receptor [Bacteroidales bacterium]